MDAVECECDRDDGPNCARCCLRWLQKELKETDTTRTLEVAAITKAPCGAGRGKGIKTMKQQEIKVRVEFTEGYEKKIYRSVSATTAQTGQDSKPRGR